MVGINHVTGEWWWIPGTLGLKQGCPMKDRKIDNKNKLQSLLVEKMKFQGYPG